MKSLADQLIRNRAATSPEELRARELLKRPAPNHAAGDPWGMVCDRFVFGPEAVQAIGAGTTHLEGLALGEALNIVRWPADIFWMEMANYSGDRWGMLKDCDRVTIVIAPSACPPIVFASFGLSDLASGGEISFGNRFTGPEKVQDLADLFGRGLLGCIVLADHRLTSVRRVLPSFVDRARRAHARRQEQRGAPIHSYNVVDLILPKTAMHRGELKPVESFAGMRGHLVIGHWRLVDGRPEPYWVWVDGHHRGDDRLGVITKERHVRLAGGERRGFRMPERTGGSGERIKAERA